MSEQDDYKQNAPKLRPGETFLIGLRTLPNGEADAKIFNKPAEDHPLYQQIGRVAAEWANYEHTLDRIIWYLVDIDMSVIGCVTGQMMGHAPRLNAIIALLSRADGSKEVIKSAQSLLNASYEAANERNRIVHDSWLGQLQNGAEVRQFRSMSPKDPRFGICDVGGEQAIEETIAKIQRRVEDANRLDDTVRKEIVTQGAVAFGETMAAALRGDDEEPVQR